ncbi:MAG: hypothetical protein WED33_01765 [Bacteroidia bacterium]
MIPEIRKKYNEEFSEELYQEFLEDINSEFKYKITFRVAESPVFFPATFREKLQKAGDEIIKTLLRKDFKELSAPAIPPRWNVPGEDHHATFLALDFAVCLDEKGELDPQLIELQGFPSLFAFQDYIQSKYKEYFYCPEGYEAFFNGVKSSQYRKRFKNLLLNGHAAENVILLEVEPEKQSTSIDFVVTEKVTGVKAICISKVIREGRKLFYMNKDVKTPIHRIYNRVIVDEFSQRSDLNCQFNLTEEVDVEWAGHPNWFFRVSKFIMPYLESANVPWCNYLSEIKELPSDLENYVLKPLFSFSGTGVKFHVTKEDIESIPSEEKKNFMLQKKVKYEPVLQAIDGKIKVEVRLLYFWEQENEKPELMVNLSRLSRGEMIGVKYNKDKTWVGGNVCFFEL